MRYCMKTQKNRFDPDACNSSADQEVDLEIHAVKFDSTEDKDIVKTVSGKYLVAQTPQSYTYDDDGNMTGNGAWTYTWNGENRMIQAESADKKLEFAYDFMGRRFSKKVYTGSTGNWTLSTHQKFVYNGDKQMAEYDANDALQKSYTWQPDELDVPLWIKYNSTYYFYIVDGNKNVRAMVDASGNEVAQYDYNPFGKVVVSKESYASTNKFRFSSEYHDDETGLVYYNYRYYNVDLGRWMSCDPIEEEGGYNLYGMVHNNPINKTDYLGMHWTDWIPGIDTVSCIGACIEANDPMNYIVDSVVGKLSALMIGGGVPKTFMAWYAKNVMKDYKLAAKILRGIKMGWPIGWKPGKIIGTWIFRNKAIAAKGARIGNIVLAIYGTVLAVIEADCTVYCCQKGGKNYDGGNIFNTKRAVDYWVNKISF